MADEFWQTAPFRKVIASKLDEAIRGTQISTSRNSVEMENHVFQKAKTKEEYLAFTARLILYMREISTKKENGMNGEGSPEMQDPINALENLTIQDSNNSQTTGMHSVQNQNLLQTQEQNQLGGFKQNGKNKQMGGGSQMP